jgi:DNA-binding IclR family transcriptional regulator
MTRTHAERVALALQVVRERGTVRGIELGVAIGLPPAVGSTFSAQLAEEGWLHRISRGVYMLGPRVLLEEGTDAWLAVEQLKHGPLSLDELAEVLDVTRADVGRMMMELQRAGRVIATRFELAREA